MTERIWILDYNGRLGNRLKLLTHVAAAALAHRRRISNPAFWKYRAGFAAWKNSCTDFLPGFAQLAIPARAERVGRGIFLTLARIATAGGVPGIGWLRCPDDRQISLEGEEFSRILRQGPRHLLLWGYNFSAPQTVRSQREALRNLFQPARPPAKPSRFTLAVHIRRGDYREFDQGRYFFSRENYLHWIRQALARWREHQPRCLVFSDEDPGEAIRREPGVELAGGNLFDDLFRMAASDVILGPPSSFSDWAAWYGGVKRLRIESAQQELRTGDLVDVEVP